MTHSANEAKAKQQPQVSIDPDGILACPVCGGCYLHQHEVEAGWRVEDGDVFRHVSSFNSTKTDVRTAKNVDIPNGYGYRRNYLVLRLECENCGHYGIELCIYQSKGQTMLEWVSAGQTVPDDDPFGMLREDNQQ